MVDPIKKDKASLLLASLSAHTLDVICSSIHRLRPCVGCTLPLMKVTPSDSPLDVRSVTVFV